MNRGDFKAIKPLQIAPENAGNGISEALKLKIFQGRMPPGPPRGYHLRRAFIPNLLRQILDPPQMLTRIVLCYVVNRIYNKILDRDWFSARLFVT